MKINRAPRWDFLAGLLRRLIRFDTAENACAFCQSSTAAHYRHLLDVPSRKILCACQQCASHVEPLEENFKLIPTTARRLSDFQMTDYQWDGLSLPINLAFFYRDNLSGEMAVVYPQPDGLVKDTLSNAQWAVLEEENPALAEMQADIEALLVNRVGFARDYFIAPVDQCHELADRLLLRWRQGPDGEQAWGEIHEFFTALRKEAEIQPNNTEISHA